MRMVGMGMGMDVIKYEFYGVFSMIMFDNDIKMYGIVTFQNENVPWLFSVASDWALLLTGTKPYTLNLSLSDNSLLS